ncbi:MAG: DUF502 domain-containing protein [Gammaproteobacteria bacterium]|jgi:uncharacterized membrane protein|nr:DUF502 domain-containing protein [Gammaproteobacteria bacterium]
MASGKHGTLNFKRNFIAGLLTVIPLAITLWLFQFLFKLLSQFGQPVVRAIQKDLGEETPVLSVLFRQPWFDDLLAVVIVVVAIYVLGVVAGRVIGAQILHALESLVARLPLVQSVYGAVKKLVGVLQTKPENVERVVLISFPTERMRTVGLVTRTLIDQHTGQQLAAVYVPTTPNPTSGYLEVVPVDDLVSTNWTIDEAMNFIISGGAIAPDSIPFSRDAPESATNQPPAG